MEKPSLRFDGVYADKPKKKEIVPEKKLWEEFWNDENRKNISEEIEKEYVKDGIKDEVLSRRYLNFEGSFCQKVLESLDQFLEKNKEESSIILWDVIGTLVEPGFGKTLNLRPSAPVLFDFINRKHKKLKIGILSDNSFKSLNEQLDYDKGLLKIKKFIDPEYIFSVSNNDYRENIDYFSGGQEHVGEEEERGERKTKTIRSNRKIPWLESNCF